MLKIYTTIFFLIFLNVSAEVIQKLEIKGNDRIGAETIKVYGEINIGEDYSSFDIDKILKNLYKTNFFKDIKISLSNGVLNITVEEYAMINFIDIQGEESSKIKKKVLETLKLQPKQSFIVRNFR